MLAFIGAADSRGKSNMIRVTYLAHVRSIFVGTRETTNFLMCLVPTSVGPESMIRGPREVIE